MFATATSRLNWRGRRVVPGVVPRSTGRRNLQPRLTQSAFANVSPAVRSRTKLVAADAAVPLTCRITKPPLEFAVPSNGAPLVHIAPAATALCRLDRSACLNTAKAENLEVGRE